MEEVECITNSMKRNIKVISIFFLKCGFWFLLYDLKARLLFPYYQIAMNNDVQFSFPIMPSPE